MSLTLFERIGGIEAVDAAVRRFYEIVIADNRIKHFFEGVDMKKMLLHQKLFLTQAFGGIENYHGKSMRDAHTNLVEKYGLSDEHFDAVMEDLAQALKDLNVPEDLIEEAAQIAESTRSDVLNR